MMYAMIWDMIYDMIHDAWDGDDDDDDDAENWGMIFGRLEPPAGNMHLVKLNIIKQ